MNKWDKFNTALSAIRTELSKAYFLMPNASCEEDIFRAFDGIDEALKTCDKYLLSREEYAKKHYGWGIVSDTIDDHTSVWGGAGPDCIPRRLEAA